jgi:hypothetical protein
LFYRVLPLQFSYEFYSIRGKDRGLAALMERLGLGGREMTASGHSKDFVLKVVQVPHPLQAGETEAAGIEKSKLAGHRTCGGLS